jgi:hypothetical protein
LYCLHSNKGFLWLSWLFAHSDGFVCVAKTIIIVLTPNEYAKEREAPSECVEYGGACVNCARTSQGYTALIWAALFGDTACVQTLVAAKAALDIKKVSSKYSDLLFQADYFYCRLLGFLIFIRIIRIVRVILVIIFVGQFKLLVLPLLVLESMV